MTNPAYKLTYFDFNGSRGLECRLALFLNGVEFEDYRLVRGEWPGMKPTTPFGSLPTLTVEGRPPVAQSNAILTFIGREHGLHPKDPWDAARHEAVFGAVEDYRAAAAQTGSKDEDEKKRKRQEFASGYLQRWATHVERQIEGPFLDGAQLHLADLKIYSAMEMLMVGEIDYIDSSVFEGFPKLRGLHAAVAAHPKVVEWWSIARAKQST